MSELFQEARRRREAYDRARADSEEWSPKLIGRLHALSPTDDFDSDEELRGWLRKDKELNARRDAYHETVRGLHASGISVSEIVGGVGAPEREVQGITGTLTCSFCGKAKNEVAKLIAGPKLEICDRCVGLASAVIRGDTPSNPGPAFQRSQANDVRCRFCQKGQSQVEAIVEAGRLRICNECVDLCHEILLEEGVAASSQQ